MIRRLPRVAAIRSAAMFLPLALTAAGWGQDNAALQPYLQSAVLYPYVQPQVFPAPGREPVGRLQMPATPLQPEGQAPATLPDMRLAAEMQPLPPLNPVPAASRAPLQSPPLQEPAPPRPLPAAWIPPRNPAAAAPPAPEPAAPPPVATLPAGGTDAVFSMVGQEWDAVPDAAPGAASTDPADRLTAANANNPNNPDRIGQAPENHAEQFLRENTILLKPGQWKIDVALSYLVDQKPFAALSQQGSTFTLVNGRIDRRLMMADFGLRYGISERWQAFADLPVGWTNTEIATLGVDNYLNGGGLGDTNFGLSWLCHKSCGDSYDPDIVLTGTVTAPTSNTDYLANLLITPQASLGQGFWAGSWNLMFVHNYDPVIVYYGLGSRHTLTRSEDGLVVQAGDQYSYRFGLGFAVNEHVTLSSAMTGAYITEPRINGQLVPGTSLEPVYLRLAVTLAGPCERICEPFVEIGLTDDAANSRFGFVWSF